MPSENYPDDLGKKAFSYAENHPYNRGRTPLLTLKMSKTAQLDADTENVLKQFREFLSSYNKLSEMCFTDCVHDLTTRKVLDSEGACATNCMDKYLKMTQRISQRFQEYQMQQTDPSILAKQGAAGASG